jgi:hypothetical protein
MRTKLTDRCTDCWCQGESPAPSNVPFQASLPVYSRFDCSSGDCALDADGVIAGAVAAGSATTYTVVFAIPYFGDEVVFDIGAKAGPDAAARLMTSSFD